MFVFVIVWAVQVGAGVSKQLNVWLPASIMVPRELRLLRLIFALGRVTKCSLKSDLALIGKIWTLAVLRSRHGSHGNERAQIEFAVPLAGMEPFGELKTEALFFYGWVI